LSNEPDQHADVADDGDERDRELLAAIARGDRRALEEIYLRYRPRLARFLDRLGARPELVDESVNETMWAVWRNAATFRGESKIATWIIGIAYRRLIKALRDDPARRHVDEPRAAMFEDAGAATADADRNELRDWLRRGLALLPAEQRATIELAYYLGQSCEEIAAIMNVAVGTVKARMFHARVRLRNTLPALGGETPRTGSLP
jgi:RNA polymerase sigma-70 factor (ECF subfamily)